MTHVEISKILGANFDTLVQRFSSEDQRVVMGACLSEEMTTADFSTGQIAAQTRSLILEFVIQYSTQVLLNLAMIDSLQTTIPNTGEGMFQLVLLFDDYRDDVLSQRERDVLQDAFTRNRDLADLYLNYLDMIEGGGPLSIDELELSEKWREHWTMLEHQLKQSRQIN